MMNEDYELKNTILNLLKTGREDDWWDFKQCHHNNTVHLLHDIICLANNRANRDAYLIFGVEDKTWKIIGVENDPNRRNQQNIVQLLKERKFAGDIRPRVEVRTVVIDTHEIDVFIVKNSIDVPYYLTKDYYDKNNKDYRVRAYHIYTRVMDNNTDIDKNADIRDIEYLWKKRFGLIQTPLEHIRVLLANYDEWKCEEEKYYHKQFPQYTIELEYDDSDFRMHRMFYHHVQINDDFSYGTFKIFHYNTQMYSCQSTTIDGGRMIIPCPDREFLSIKNCFNLSECIFYYTLDSLKYRLLSFFWCEREEIDKPEADEEMRRHLDVVLIFNDKSEVKAFKEYVENNQDTLNEFIDEQKEPPVTDENDRASKVIAHEIKTGYALKKMQKLFETR